MYKFGKNVKIQVCEKETSWLWFHLSLRNVLEVSVCESFINPLIANLTRWSNTLKQFVGKLPTNCLSVFDHFVGLAFKGLSSLLNL